MDFVDEVDFVDAKKIHPAGEAGLGHIRFCSRAFGAAMALERPFPGLKTG